MLISLEDRRPRVAGSAWVAPNATVVGDVLLAEEVGVWYSATIRGDVERIEVGARSNVQDGSVLHADPGFPVNVGMGVTIGHNATVHGCTIGDDVLIGMGATVLNGATIGAGSLVAAGTVVLAGTEIPPGTLVAGLPGKVRRELTDEELASIRVNAQVYVELRAQHAAATPLDGS
jgi:carbonic anhydrase/acetyltransferase-like protein (isoleucine patch superfamily)